MKAMTIQEQRDWVRLLGRTLDDQIRVIRELIKNHLVDKMSYDDLVICRQQLPRLYDERDGRGTDGG
jgi:hypothetical protein